MMICGLQVIVLPNVPASLKFGRRSVVVTPSEAADLMQAVYGDRQLLIDLLEGHAAYLDTLVAAQ